MDSEARLELHVTRAASGATVVKAVGEIDLDTYTELREELIAAIASGVTVLDLAEVDFFDSSGIRALAVAERAARRAGTALRLAALSGHVRRVLELAGALDYFRVFPDTDSALGD